MRSSKLTEKWIYWWFITLCASCIIIAATTTLFILHRDIVFKDPRPNLTPLIPYLPQQNPWETPIVSVGIIINNIPTIDITRNEATINATLFFTYDPEIVAGETIDKFFFEPGTIEQKESPKFNISGKLITAEYRVRVKLTPPLNFEQFPLDDHRIYLLLTNNSISSDQLAYRATPAHMTISKNVQIQGWSIHNIKAQTGVLQTGNTSHPAVLITLDFQKQAFGHLLTIIIPLIILFFIALITLIPTEKTIFSLNLCVGNIAALLAYRFVIQNISPTVGYLTIADKLYGFVLLASIACLIFNLIGLANVLSSKNKFIFGLAALITTIILSITYILIIHHALLGNF